MTGPLAVRVSVHLNSVERIAAVESPSGGFWVDLAAGEVEVSYPAVVLFGSQDDFACLVTAITTALAAAAIDGEGSCLFRGPSRDAEPLASGIVSTGPPEHPHGQALLDTPGACLCCGVELGEENTALDGESCRACFANPRPITTPGDLA